MCCYFHWDGTSSSQCQRCFCFCLVFCLNHKWVIKSCCGCYEIYFSISESLFLVAVKSMCLIYKCIQLLQTASLSEWKLWQGFYCPALNWSAEANMVNIKENTFCLFGLENKNKGSLISIVSFLDLFFMFSFSVTVLESQTFSAFPCCGLNPPFAFASCHHGL